MKAEYKKKPSLYVLCGKIEYNFLTLVFSEEPDNQMLAENIMKGKTLSKNFYYLDFRLLYHFKQQIKILKSKKILD